MRSRKQRPASLVPFRGQLTEDEVARFRKRWESLTTAERNAMITVVDPPSPPSRLQRWLRRLRGRRS